MNRLRISLTNIPEDGVELDERVVVRDIHPPEAEALPVDVVSLQGTLMPLSDDYLFQGRIAGAFVHPCDRCLQPARSDFDLTVYWLFQEGAAEDLRESEEEDEEETELLMEGLDTEGDFKPFSGDEIDLGPSLWEEIALAMPVKYVCDEACKGLCSHCGANLNQTTCGCEREEAGEVPGDNAFARLRDLFPDLPK